MSGSNTFRKLSACCIAFVAALAIHLPVMAMPATVVSIVGMGNTLAPSIVNGTPPDPNSAVGPTRIVEVVNGGIEIFDKTGIVVQAARLVKTLWAGYTGTNAGNGCSTRNDGDPMVRYDRMAGRWIVTQISVPNLGSSGPYFQCVAVSKTGDPAGAYWLYDFSYPNASPGAPSLGVWPDAYYFAQDQFSTTAFLGPHVCAWNRAAMLAGLPATQECFSLGTNYGGLLPADLDGPLPPPDGSPEYVIAEDIAPNTLDVWKFHVDWTTPANSTLTGPTLMTTVAFTDACPTACIPQSSQAQHLASVSGRLMDRAAYRNFGTHESVVVNQTVQGSGGAAGPTALRWYELRFASGTPSIYQQGTFEPPDLRYRWLGSMAQDQAGDMALGYSTSSSTTYPAIAWAGRLGTDALNTMSQPEAIIATGLAYEASLSRWGDFSSMQIDPSDDCTFCYTNELYNAAGATTWDTRISSTKFPSCASNVFSLGAAPAALSVTRDASGSTTITTSLTKGSAEALSLTAYGLPAGTTASFNPTSVTSGQNATVTFNVGDSTATGTYTITVGATGQSAYHATTVTLTVTNAPVVTSVSPSAGPASGGTVVTVTGMRLSGTTSVSFGSTPATNFSVVNDTTITATAPAGTGTVDVTVTSPAGTNGTSPPDQFTYLPFVAALPAMANAAYGGYTTVSEIQNVGGGNATVLIQYLDSSGAIVGSGDSVSALHPDATWTVRQDNGHSFAVGAAGSARVYSNRPLATFVNEFAPGGTDATSYTGIKVPPGSGTTLYAPAIANNAYGGYTTGIGLINTGTGPTDIQIVYRDPVGSIVTTQVAAALPAHAYAAYYSGDTALALPSGFAGTATIVSSAQPVAAVVNEIGPGGRFSSYDAAAAGNTRLLAPVALNGAFGGYFTGMGVQNTTGTSGTVGVTYYNPDGSTAKTVNKPISANGYLGLYQGDPTDGPPSSANGYSAVLTPGAGIFLAAIVNEVAPAPAAQSTAYNTFGFGLLGGQLPLVESSGSDGWSTGLGIMNTGAAATSVTVTYYDTVTGAQVGTPFTSASLAPNAFLGVYQPSAGLPAGTRATAVVTGASVDAQFALICNESSSTTFMSYDGQ